MVWRSSLAGPRVATILACLVRRISSAPLAAIDQDGAKVVDVGERRAGDDGVAQCAEEAVAVVVVQALARMDAACPGARQRVGRQERTRDLFLAVDAVGVGGDRVHA